MLVSARLWGCKFSAALTGAYDGSSFKEISGAVLPPDQIADRHMSDKVWLIINSLKWFQSAFHRVGQKVCSALFTIMKYNNTVCLREKNSGTLYTAVQFCYHRYDI